MQITTFHLYRMAGAANHEENILIATNLLKGRPTRKLKIREASNYIDLCINLALSSGKAFEMGHLYDYLTNMESAVKVNLILAEGRKKRDCPPLHIRLAVDRPRHGEPNTWQEWFREMEWTISRGLEAMEDEVSELQVLFIHIRKMKEAAQGLKENLMNLMKENLTILGNLQ